MDVPTLSSNGRQHADAGFSYSAINCGRSGERKISEKRYLFSGPKDSNRKRKGSFRLPFAYKKLTREIEIITN